MHPGGASYDAGFLDEFDEILDTSKDMQSRPPILVEASAEPGRYEHISPEPSKQGLGAATRECTEGFVEGLI